MQRSRILLIVFITLWFAVPLLDSSTCAAPIKEVVTEVERTPVLAPVDNIVPSDSSQYFDFLRLDYGHGDFSHPLNMDSEDGLFGSLVEVNVYTPPTTQYSFQRLFRFNCEAYQYLSCFLEIEGYDDPTIAGYWAESLRFFYSESAEGPWTELGILSAQTSTFYSWSINVPSGSVFHIKAESTDQVNDWGSRNEWKLDYLRVRCIDRKSENGIKE
jgi:hypothetical protein